ncbi:MAG: hypothetical protein L0387_42530 [Acidobacteria bacterium]|nr:hypothetical protein [Acidobacteriota bacterium]MCI0722013.1 hypothetical protein [Acidobacteriota bacterium]
MIRTNRYTGFLATRDFRSPDNGVTFPIRLETGLPPLQIDRNALGQSGTTVQRKTNLPQQQQWNFGIQQGFFVNFLFEAAYVGSKGTHLVANNRNINQVPANLLGPGNAQSRRPFPQYGDIILDGPLDASSTYHSLQLKLDKRFSQGMSILSAFTFSKMIDDDSGVSFAPTGSSSQDILNLRLERSLSTADRTKVFTTAYVWELPFGPGQKWAAGASGTKAKLIEGWQVSGIVSLRDGLPAVITNTPNQTGSLGGGSRPNRVSGVDPELQSSERTPEKYFNTAAYTPPAPFAFGGVSRTEPQLRLPGFAGIDFSLNKSTAISEGYSLQFRTEIFNLFNRTNFGNPGTVLGTPQFGRIFSAGSARAIQFGLKFIF